MTPDGAGFSFLVFSFISPVGAAVELPVTLNCCFHALFELKALNALSCSLHAHVNAFALMLTIR